MAQRRPSILVVDADSGFRRSVVQCLEESDCVGAESATFTDAIDRVNGFAYDGLIVDVRLPGGDGLDVLSTALSRYPGMACIVIADLGNFHHAVKALKLGAVDYLTKPLDGAQVTSVMHLALARRSDRPATSDENKPQLNDLEGLLGASPAMIELADVLRRVAPMQSSVLIQGETGTGKELVARKIHENSTRRQHPFVAFNAAAIPEGLAEAELFGHIKGAFTGAVSSRVGRFEAADRGTLFIDELSSMSLSLQAKLLRALQEREIEPVGTSRPMKINTRVIAASNEDLAELVREGRFREDLYYRLNVVRVQLPALRQRIEDIPVLARHFVDATCRENDLSPKTLSQATLQTLMQYHWPGNVRQLQNAVECAVVMNGSAGEIEPRSLPSEIREPAAIPVESPLASIGVPMPSTPPEGINFANAMSQIERDLILTYLKRAGGNKRQAARLLSLSRTTLIDKLHRLGVAERATGNEAIPAVA